MNDDVSAMRDVLWKMYQEHCTQGRHHESQRSSVAAALIAVAGAIIGLVTFDDSISGWDVPLTLLLAAIGAFGALFSAKHYERFSMHMERARAYRDALDETLPGRPLKPLKVAADEISARDFPLIRPLRLNRFWTGLYLLICAIGLVLIVVAAVSPTPRKTDAEAPAAAAAEPSAGNPPAHSVKAGRRHR